MDDISKIWSGAGPVGNDLPGRGDYRVSRKIAEKKPPSSFRPGEIIQGKILEIPEKGIARLRLPNGIFSAVLHDSLKPGDELFFLVSETEPSLVLKAHSILSGRVGGNPEPAEILRLLNLPDTELFRSTAEFLYETESIIKRDEVISLEKNFRDIFGDSKLTKIAAKLSLISDFILSGVVIDNFDLDKILPFYESEKSIEDIIRLIDGKTQELEMFIALSKLTGNDSMMAKPGMVPFDTDFLNNLSAVLAKDTEFSEILKNFNSFFNALEYRSSIPQFADNYILLIFAGIASGKFVIHKFKTRRKKHSVSMESFISNLLGMGFEKVWTKSKDSRELMSGISNILLRDASTTDFKILEYKLFSSGGKYLLFSTPHDVRASKISVVL